MTEQPHETMERAAARLEKLAADTSPAPWSYEGGAIRRPGTDGYTIAPVTDWVERDGNAHWICAMPPAVAAPLVAWLRLTAVYTRYTSPRGLEHVHVEQALTFARMVLGESEAGQS